MKDLKNRITILFIRIFLGGYSGQKQISFEDYNDRVYLFKGDLAAGMCFWWDKLLMKDELFQEEYENAKDYVYLHELSHKQENGLISLAGGIPQWLLHPLVVSIELLTIITAIASFLFDLGNYQSLVPLARTGATVSIFLLPASIVTSWILETKPDLFAVRHIGTEKYQKAIDELEELYSDRSAVNRIFSRLSHPTPSFVLKVVEMKNDTSS